MDNLKQHIQNNLDQLDIDHPKEDLWNELSDEISRAGDRDLLKDHIEQNADELEVETPGEHSWSKIEYAISGQKPVRLISFKKLAPFVAAASLVIFIIVSVLLHKNRTSAKGNETDLVTAPAKNDSPVTNLLPADTMKELVDRSPVKSMPAEKRTYTDQKMTKQETKEVVHTSKKHNNLDKERKVHVQNAVNKKLPLEIIQTQTEFDNLIAGQVSLIQGTPVYGESVGYFAGFIDDFKQLDKQEKKLRAAIMQKGMEENSLDELAMIYQKKMTVLKMMQREISQAGNSSRSATDTIPVFIKL